MTAGTRITESEKKNDNQKGLANELTGNCCACTWVPAKTFELNKEKAKSRLHDFELLY